MTTPLTVAESSKYTSTSRYDDVVAFLKTVVPRSPFMRLDTIGYTVEKRAMPLVIVGRLQDFSPAGVRASGKTVVYVQGNIHGGEVEGKEAVQMLLRDLLPPSADRADLRSETPTGFARAVFEENRPTEAAA